MGPIELARRKISCAANFALLRSRSKRGLIKWLPLFVLTLAAPTFAQRIQSASESCSWATSCTTPFLKNVAAGDSIAVVVKVSAWETGPQPPAVSDSQGNRYGVVISGSAPSAAYQVFLFCAPKASAGADSITSTIPIANNQDMVTLEFQGSCAVDSSTTASGISTSATTQSIPAHSGDFIVGVGASKYADTFKPTAGFTAEGNLGDIVVADSSQTTTGNADVTFTLGSSTSWTALLVAFSSAPSSGFSITATLKWDDGTPVAGTIAISQQVSTSPLTMNSLGTFPLDTSGMSTGNVNPNFALPLTFIITLINPAGAVVNSITLFANNQILQTAPYTFNASIVLAKSNAAVQSVSF